MCLLAMLAQLVFFSVAGSLESCLQKQALCYVVVLVGEMNCSNGPLTAQHLLLGVGYAGCCLVWLNRLVVQQQVFDSVLVQLDTNA